MTVTLGNGTTTYGYNDQAALDSLSHDFAGTGQDNTWTYTRNRAQEITRQTVSNDDYQWAGYGDPGSHSYTPNGLNQYTGIAGNALSYDGNGNLKSYRDGTYTYNPDNRLKTATRPGLVVNLLYDAEGRLRQTSTVPGNTSRLLYADSQLVAEYDGANTLQRRYVHGPGVDEPLVWYEGPGTANKTWLYADHQGSLVALANANGVATSEPYRYGPYGEPDRSTGIRFRYTGQQYLAALNLYYYKARFYSPELGRFLQTDPIGYEDGLNWYLYVGNNPVNRRDPSGLCFLFICPFPPGGLPDDDGEVTFLEAYVWHKVGHGEPLSASIDSLDLSGVSSTNFSGVGTIKPIKLDSPTDQMRSLSDGLVYGTVKLKLQQNNVITGDNGGKSYDNYDFDLKPWDGLKTNVRNILTIGADLLHGYGQDFKINLTGSSQLGNSNLGGAKGK